jgi:HNH endonuclease
MTWTKLGSEFFDECAAQGLSDAAVRTHAEAIGWIYGIENTELCFERNLIRRFAGSNQWEAAVTELVRLGWWIAHEDMYVLVHHAEFVRATILAIRGKRSRDKRAQQCRRDKTTDPILVRDGYRCRYCGETEVTLEIDHVIPVVFGGSSTLDNLVTSCSPCNRRKGSQIWVPLPLVSVV